jgi:hypothetical protein
MKTLKQFKRYIVTTTHTVEQTSVVFSSSEAEAIAEAKVDPRPRSTNTTNVVINKVEVCK